MRFYSKDSIASHNCCIEHNGCWFVISNNDTVLVPYANPKNKIDIMDVPKHKARIDSLCESIDEKNEYAPLCADIYKHNRN
ncbi:hypothetical protein AGMMS49938_16580 [Fibrobacterales bacterium]|nr:hypothetical protein AGMMS49938_16580 [Fibrobacterales bacterium]